MLATDDACGDRAEALPIALSRFRHFGDQWQHICQTLLSCERLLTVMSDDDRHDTNDTTRRTTGDDTDDTHDANDRHDVDDRQQLRRIIRSIEPKKYSKNNHSRRQSRTETRRSSYHRLKALTQLLMSSNLKRSTSLQSVPIVQSDDTDDTTATLPRLRRRPRINRFYHSLDVSDDVNDAKADRSGLSLDLSSPQSQLTADVEQKKLNRHSCDVTSLLKEQKDSQPNRTVLKYSKKRLRGPYGEMLESMMNTKNATQEEEVKQSLSFIQELLRETEKQRKALDSTAKETTGTADLVTTATTNNDTDDTSSITATIGRHLDARTHIVGELYDTEKSFVEQLRDLQDKYARPLQEQLIVDSLFVDAIFGKVPELLHIHAKFLEELRHRISSWSRDSCVGDLFARFDDKHVCDAYLAFVDNWFQSKTLIKQLARDKPQFARFLQEHRVTTTTTQTTEDDTIRTQV